MQKTYKTPEMSLTGKIIIFSVIIIPAIFFIIASLDLKIKIFTTSIFAIFFIIAYIYTTRQEEFIIDNKKIIHRIYFFSKKTKERIINIEDIKKIEKKSEKTGSGYTHYYIFYLKDSQKIRFKQTLFLYYKEILLNLKSINPEIEVDTNE